MTTGPEEIGFSAVAKRPGTQVEYRHIRNHPLLNPSLERSLATRVTWGNDIKAEMGQTAVNKDDSEGRPK